VKARLTVLLAALAIAAIGAGCGDEDSGDSAEANGSLSKAEFVKQASSVCRQERKALAKDMSAYLERQRSKKLPEPVLIANMFKAVFVPVVEAEMAGIRKLGAPAGDEQQIEAILVAEQGAIDKLERLKRAKSIGAFNDYFAPADKKLRAYGLPVCAKGA
jgi:hypothetical protein